MSPLLTTGQTTATGAQAAMTAVPQTATGQAVPVTALAVEITRQAMNGKTQFDIRLDPPELGRLNVRLEMDASGQTRTHMVVERAETLDMLTTDARSLERALQQAGLKAEPGSVSFELAQDAADGFAQGQHSAGTDDQSGESGSDTPALGPEADPMHSR
jgi:flagellar hook-length control protein FliK